MYAIVEYIDSSESDDVPLKWVEKWDGGEIADVTTAIELKTTVFVLYPPYRTDAAIQKAKANLAVPDRFWLKFNGRILGTAGTLKFLILNIK